MLYYTQREALRVAELRAQLGAPESTVGVMLNGSYISFETAQPVKIGGRVYVPFDELMKALGAQSISEPGSAVLTASVGDVTLRCSVGSSVLSVPDRGGNADRADGLHAL